MSNQSPDALRGRPRLLVMDDDPLFRSLLISFLRRDYLVSVASNGSEGFYKAEEHTPDAAIIDIQMPGWDGLQTLKAFRSCPSLAKVPVVILTSDASRETVMAAIQAGAQDYIIKTGFTKEELLKKLERLFPVQVVGRAGDRPTGPSGVGTSPRPSSTVGFAAPQAAAAPKSIAGASRSAAVSMPASVSMTGSAAGSLPSAKERTMIAGTARGAENSIAAAVEAVPAIAARPPLSATVDLQNVMDNWE
jgi:CheY-like chemotaxis protein